MRFFGLFVFILTVLYVPTVLAQEGEQTQYTLEAELDIYSQSIKATQEVVYVNNGDTDLDALYFILAPNLNREPNPNLSPVIVDSSYDKGFDASWLDVYDVIDEAGNALSWSYEAGPETFQSYSLEQNLLKVDLPNTLAPGQAITVVVEFETRFPSSLNTDQSFHQNIYTWRFAWNPVAVTATDLVDGKYHSEGQDYVRWRYPAALYEMSFTVPDHYTVVTGLDTQEETSVDELAGTKTLLLKSDVPVRSIPLSISPDFKRYTLPNQDIPVHVYYLPSEEAAARQIATYAVEILDSYNENRGAYGYKQLSIVTSWASGYFGMAADGFIILGNSGFAEKDLTVAGMADRFLEYLLAHEIAHMWWGIGVSTDLNAENFLSEAFAEYLSISYFEEKYGNNRPNVIQVKRKGFLENLIDSQFGYLNLRQHFSELPYLVVHRDRFDEALVKPQQAVEFANNNQTRIYNKGYLVLRALEGVISSESMDQLLLETYEKFNHNILDTDLLKTQAENISGLDMDAFFEDWVYGDASIDYGIERVKTDPNDDGTYTTTVSLKHEGEGRLPVEVVLLSEDGTLTRQTWTPESETETLTFILPAPLLEVQVDPESWTPDVARIDNYFPTRLRIIPDGGVDVPLDSYLIRFDPISQILEGGYVLDYRWLLADGLIAFVMNQGRGNTIDGALVFGDDVLAEFGWNATLYEHPDLGLQGQYWEPSHRLRLSISRRLNFDETPVNYGGITYTFSQLLNARHVFQANALVDPFSFTRLNAAAVTQSLLFPNVTLDLQADFGYSMGELPEFLYFNLAELNSFYDFTDEGAKRKLTFPGRYKGSARLSVSFPMQRDMAYSVAGLALVREIRGNVYVAAAQTWDDFDQFDIDMTLAEGGFEATASGQMFGGLLSFNVTAGVAISLLGSNGPADFTIFEPYLRLGIPFL